MNPFWSVVLAFLLTVEFLMSAMAESHVNRLEDRRAVVVKLRVHRRDQEGANESYETASGVYVGRDRQNAYFITARHAIAPDEEKPPVRDIEMQFYTTGNPFRAQIFQKFNTDLDLGVVSTGSADFPSNPPLLVAGDVREGMKVEIWGHPPGSNWNNWSGEIQSENGTSDEVRRFKTNLDNSLAGGYSGGPVFDTDGNFLGMHIHAEDKYGIAVKSGDILRQLEAWRIPTNNVTTLDSIQEILDHYEDALNSGDMLKVKSLRLLTPRDEKTIADSLKATTKDKAYYTIEKESCTTPLVIRDKATVTCGIVLNGGKEIASKRWSATFTLERYYNRWFIVADSLPPP